jgi:hypothetical protein
MSVDTMPPVEFIRPPYEAFSDLAGLVRRHDEKRVPDLEENDRRLIFGLGAYAYVNRLHQNGRSSGSRVDPLLGYGGRSVS